METAEIRRRWLTFFGERGHTVVPSAPLVHDDPNLLFVNAGMVPFKPYFLGQETPPFDRATSVQKCVRTLDIEEVGKTTRHGTFFQMNGNFSFGDYFKEGAIELAWELITRSQRDGGLGFDEKDLYASVYHEDDEAIALWKKVAGLSDDRIVRLGRKDNYWNMGVVGPGGPCSEILLDRGPQFGADRDWEAGDRYLEFWNLVFMQYELENVRSKEDFDIAGELPKRNIDTGMGLERVAYLLQGVDNMYETDEVCPVIAGYRGPHGSALRRRARRRRPLPRRRRPHPHLAHAHRRRGDPRQRGPGLRAAPDDAPRHPLDAPPRGRPADARAPGPSSRRRKATYPELDRDLHRISRSPSARRPPSATPSPRARTSSTPPSASAKASGRSTLGGAEAFALHDT